MAEMRFAVTADLDTTQLTRKLRVIARHLTALADELEAPDTIITFPGPLTDEQAAGIRERLNANLRPDLP